MFGEKHIRPNSLRGKNEDRSLFGGQHNSIRRMAGIAANGDQRPLRPPEDQPDGSFTLETLHTGVILKSALAGDLPGSDHPGR